jgi:hypothetical protein
MSPRYVPTPAAAEVPFELTIIGVTAITDADLTKYKQAITATIENVDASRIEITTKTPRACVGSQTAPCSR